MKHNPWPELKAFASDNGLLIIGVDEAGRGPLFGPVVAGAAALDLDVDIAELACSKTLSEKKRSHLLPVIQKEALAYATAEASVQEIDTHNILQASLLAMRRAVELVFDQLEVTPDQCLVLVDGNKLPVWKYHSKAVVKGDAWVPAISAASILAKQTRDAWCLQAAIQYPGYGIENHMGYPTATHLEALDKLGCTPYHRRSFGPVKARLNQPLQTGLFD